jgi:NAD(P)-dependent dehydrogenase (short-subunit alcohol dehydrogenase family)
VVLACRDTAKGEALAASLTADAAAAGAKPPSLLVRRLDVADLASVRQFAASWTAAEQQQPRPLHALVCNAGVFAMGDATRRETGDGIEAHAATNHLGHFLLTLLLLPALRAAGAPGSPARVVHVASKLHEFAAGEDLASDPLCRRAYTPLAAYARSKLAQVVFAAELGRRLGGERAVVAVTAVHPGEVATDVVRSLPPLIRRLYAATMTLVLLTPAQGARSSVWAATTPAAGGDPTLCYSGPECVRARPSKDALDPALGRWLWGWSAARVGLPAGCDLAPVA